jgi:energy-coupling factor transport system substrate-specific component
VSRRHAGTVLAALAAGLLIGCAAALASTGDRSTPVTAAARRAAGYLLRAQNTDGGLGGAPGQRSSALYSGWAALGLAADGVEIGGVRRATSGRTLLQYVQRGAGASDSGSLERTILALRAGGASVTDVGGRNLVRALLGRFSRRGAVAGLVNLTSFGVLALCAAGERSTAALQRRAAGWLARESDRDGGYGFAGRGSQSDADDTGAVLEALHCAGGAGSGSGAAGRAISRARRRAIAYLRRDQDRDGGFPAAPGAGSNAQSTAWTIQGLIAAGVDPSTLRRDGATPSSYLVSLVSRDGAVRYARGKTVSPVWVTGEALLALTGTPLPVTAP